MNATDSPGPIGRLGWIQIDCADPERLAAFLSQVLSVEIASRLGDPVQFVNLAAAEPSAPQVCPSVCSELLTIRHQPNNIDPGAASQRATRSEAGMHSPHIETNGRGVRHGWAEGGTRWT